MFGGGDVAGWCPRGCDQTNRFWQWRRAQNGLREPPPFVAVAQPAHHAELRILDERDARLPAKSAHGPVTGEGPRVAGLLMRQDPRQADRAVDAAQPLFHGADADDQRRAESLQPQGQLGQCAGHGHVLSTGGVWLCPVFRLGHIEWNERTARRCLDQRTVIGAAQVAFEPDELHHGAIDELSGNSHAADPGRAAARHAATRASTIPVTMICTTLSATDIRCAASNRRWATTSPDRAASLRELIRGISP